VNKGLRYGLFGAGAAARTILAELPCLRQELGPIAASTMKVAARIANALKAGYAIRDLAEFDECEVILVCAPDTGLDRAVEILSGAPVGWRGKAVLFCFSDVASADFDFFDRLGASVGSLNVIDGIENYVIEGGREAVREAKRLVRHLKGKSTEIDSEKMRLFRAARTMSGSLFTPLVDSCVEWIRQSGVESKEAARLAEKMLLWTLRSYLHSGRRGWTGAAATRDWAAIEQQYKAVKKVDPLHAEYFRNMARDAFALYESYPEFARYLAKRPETKDEIVK
jgi:predicted short-subunit dehydrogenase-like oxidoreductase (DUF2520 family)